jgi:ABC-2 type transport system ATP-binding protein
MAKVVLEVRDLKKTFKSGFIPRPVTVLKGVSFKLPRGSVTGFLGANGAGKTTTIKCILQLIFSDSGTIQFFDGQELSSEVLKKIGFLPERPYFYSYLTGKEFLNFYGRLSGTPDLNSRIDGLLKRVGLEHARDRLLKDFSKGMLQRIGIAQALMHRPELVIFDEPQSGLDPDGRIEVANIIRETAKEGTTIFFSSHLLPDAEKLCDRLVVMKQGKICYEGATRDLLQQTGKGAVIYYNSEGIVKTLNVDDDGSLQKELSRLVAEKKTIQEVRREHVSLEEAYSRLAT